ncbi:hypothetical protein CHS0354_015795 [Potamilus streckersoni]|uniref:Mannosyltransferase n=1 Tax=Potamilus streckersoni TaxID=2493646 RepID=A0AAE0SD95_9BIVA|nr:hypothetical protein CHS0354_015795 [Potamilus streckersoni]
MRRRDRRFLKDDKSGGKYPMKEDKFKCETEFIFRNVLNAIYVLWKRLFAVSKRDAPVVENKCRQSIKENEQKDVGKYKYKRCRNSLENYIFPKNVHWLVFFVTLVFRVWYVCDKQNWWILHPDEIFQTLEVAHSEAFGYGFRAYEYMPPPVSENKSTASTALRQEHALGMYSLRPFILTHLLANVMIVANKLWPNISPFMVGRIFHTAVTSFLPITLYYFTTAIYSHHDIATMTSVIAVSSVHLNLFDTHTVINSVLSPSVFFALTPFMKALRTLVNRHEKTTYQMCSNDVKYRNNNNLKENGHCQRYDSNKDYNYTFHSKRKESKTLNNGNTFMVISGKCEEEDVSKRFDDNSKYSTFSHNSFQLFAGGLTFGILSYIRVDNIVLPVLLIIFTIRRNCHLISHAVVRLKNFIFGFNLGILIGGFYDWIAYQKWFISPYQWLIFNVIRDLSSVMFGSEGIRYYIVAILFDNLSQTILTISAILSMLICLSMYYGKWNAREKCYKSTQADIVILFTILSFLTLYSFHGHKELRFMQNLLVLVCILYSSAIINLVYLFHFLVNFKCVLKVATQMLTVVYLSKSFYFFYTLPVSSISQYTFEGLTGTQHINICLDYIRRQDDVTGVYLDQSIHMTGAYVTLHKNVPILTLIHNEFYEFDKKVRVESIPRFAFYGVRTNLSLSIFSKVSDFIYIKNVHYLLKVLLSKKCYNYLIISSERFIDFGYQEVFSSGRVKVYKRLTDSDSTKRLADFANGLPLGINATILEYEASWLKTFDLLHLAAAKLEYAIKLDPSRARSYILLAGIYAQSGKQIDASNILKACVKRFGGNRCYSAPPTLVHRDSELLFERMISKSQVSDSVIKESESL